MGRRFVKLWHVVVVGPILIGLGLWRYLTYETSHDIGRTADGRTITVFEGQRGKDATLIVTILVAFFYLRAIARELQARRRERRQAEDLEELVDPQADAVAQRRAAKEAAARERRAKHAATRPRPSEPPDAHPFRAAPPSGQIVPAERSRTAPVVKPAESDGDGPAILR